MSHAYLENSPLDAPTRGSVVAFAVVYGLGLFSMVAAAVSLIGG